MELSNDKINSLLFNIICGYSKEKFDSKNVFIKHPNLKQELYLSNFRETILNEQIKKGAPTLQEKLDYLNEEGSWTNKEEKELKTNRDFLETLTKSKKNLVLKQQEKELDKTISETNSKVLKAENKRNNLVGVTADDFADKKTQEQRIFLSFFKNEGLVKPFFTKNEFNEIENKELHSCYLLYSKSIEVFDDELLKKITMCPIFYNSISILSKDEMYLFFNKDIKSLSFFQQKLVAYSMNIKFIYENISDIPSWAKDNYDDLVKFTENKSKQQRKTGDSRGDGKSTVDILGPEGNGKVFDMLKKSGGKTVKKSEIVGR